MKKQIKIFAALCLLLTISCDKNEENFSESFGVLVNGTSQGFDFKLTYPDGAAKDFKNNTVFGWLDGFLLDSDYYKAMRGGSNGTSFDFRMNFPKDRTWTEMIEGEHDLRNQRLRLEQTGSLGNVQAEFWLSSSGDMEEFDPFTNVIGNIFVRLNESIADEIYGVVIEVNGSFTNEFGEKVRIEGVFWKRDAL